MLVEKKVTDRVVDVVVEPADGVSDDEIVRFLQGLGADDVELVADGYISARGPRSVFAALREKATVQEKARHAPRSTRSGR